MIRTSARRMVIMVIATVGICCNAAADRERELLGYVADMVTRKPVFSTKVTLMRTDSTVVDSARSCPPGVCESLGREVSFYRLAVSEAGTYLLRLENEGYETMVKEINVEFRKRQTMIDLPIMLMKRMQRERKLGEAVVRASKVKFYYKGDTLVYNADAFQLAEGSMLDELIRQLPGVELKDDGQIYVNGRFVESLLLNGKDFFSKDRTVMLENLPSYMVKDLKVYNRADAPRRLASRDMNDSTFVMDVSLKRQYRVGIIGNAEVGSGTGDRYLSRLFGMRFTPQSRLTFFGTMNNLNDSRRPGGSGDWSPDRLTQGLTATKMAGMDYRIEDKQGRYIVNGNAKVTYQDVDNRSTVSRQNFLTGGDTYGRQRSMQNSEQFSFDTYHSFTLVPKEKHLDWNVDFNLSYRNNRDRSDYFTAEFSKEPEADYEKTAENHPEWTLNRSIRQAYQKGHGLDVGASTFLWKMNIGETDDFASIQLKADYHDDMSQNRDHYLLSYPQTGQASDYRNRYEQMPMRRYSYSAKSSYLYAPAHFLKELYTNYEYEQRYSSDERELYRLDYLNGWGMEASRPLGALPSEDSLWMAVDRPNTYASHLLERRHRVSEEFRWRPKGKNKMGVELRLTLPLLFRQRTLHYHRMAIDTALTKNYAQFDPRVHLQFHLGNRYFNIDLRRETKQLAMSSLLTVRDDANPLSITLGNPALKSQQDYVMNGNMFIWRDPKGRNGSIDVGWTATRNSIIQQYRYDRSTGVSTVQPVNVNGNWKSNLGIKYGRPLDKQRNLSFETNTKATFYNSICEENTAERSKVKTLNISEDASVSRQMGKLRLKLRVGGEWFHTTSRKLDFETVDSWQYKYGLTGTWELPWQVQLASDIMMYSRRGFNDDALNADDIVWNARVTKRLSGGKLNLMLDGFDLLHQLSTVTPAITATGRTETWHNSLPHYLMFRLIYRLNIKPKHGDKQ